MNQGTRFQASRICMVAIVFLSLITFSAVQTVSASTTDGTIDSSDKWAWSESAGWIDFGTSAGNVHVTDSALTGYAYGENIGWISLNCSNTSSCGSNSYAVVNDGDGNLSGYAWGESIGWVHFAPSNGGVYINTSGIFTGSAYAENIGWIVFGTDHPVTTDWRRSSVRTSSSSAGSNGPPVGTLSKLPFMHDYWATLSTMPAPTTTPSVVAPAATSSAPRFTRNRRMGETGDDIRLIQQFLNTNGFVIAVSGPGSPGNETTFFGARTRAAVAAFQKAHSIEPYVGYFGPLTREYINNHY